jgi:hypothetical protein
MKELGKALKTKLDQTYSGSHNTLYNAISGRMYRGRAPENFTLPLVIFDMLYVNDPLLSTKQRKVEITFIAYTSEAGGTSCDDVAKYIEDLYQDCELAKGNWSALSVSGFSVLYFNHVQTIAAKYNYENKEWEAYVIFEALLQES